MSKTVKFLGYDCKVVYEEYHNGRTAIELVEENTGEPIAMATVNLPDEALLDSHVFIKDYSENEGIGEALMEAEIIGTPIAYIGVPNILMCKLIDIN